MNFKYYLLLVAFFFATSIAADPLPPSFCACSDIIDQDTQIPYILNPDSPCATYGCPAQEFSSLGDACCMIDPFGTPVVPINSRSTYLISFGVLLALVFFLVEKRKINI